MEKKWWKEAVVYQIYPRSFMDSNHDGIGDLKGIISRLDYLQELGVDVVWLCPVYQSPNDDNGYDISDYKSVMDEFGTMDDLEELLNELHGRGMKLIMDLVVNHTSDEHPWFIESRSSKKNPYRDYYIWKQSEDGKPPNNWESNFSGSAWEYDETTDAYYLHLYSTKQPDLNWDNPALREEIYDMMTWWLNKGIDGFRLDVINMLSKAEGLPDAPVNGRHPHKWGPGYFINGPRIHDYLQEMNEKVLSRYDIMTVGETPGVTTEDGVLYVGDDRRELNMIFQFEHMNVDSGPEGKWQPVPWKLTDFKQVMGKWQKTMEKGKGWNSLYLNNHDQPRMVSRFGNDNEYRKTSAKMLATLLHTLQGTPFIYQGEEIGMTNVAFDTIEEYRDIETLNRYRDKVDYGNEGDQAFLKKVHQKSRDNARTPMQWNGAKNAGFTQGDPWMSVNPNYKQINAERDRQDPESIFRYYQKLIQLRKEYPVMVYGDYKPFLEEDEHVYAYLRTTDSQRLLVLLNFSDETRTVMLPEEVVSGKGKLLIGNYQPKGNIDGRYGSLRPYEAMVYLD